MPAKYRVLTGVQSFHIEATTKRYSNFVFLFLHTVIAQSIVGRTLRVVHKGLVLYQMLYARGKNFLGS